MKRFMKTCGVDLSLVPKEGLYALCKYGEIVYIGQSNNILRRIGEHAGCKEKEFDSFMYIRCDDKKERDKLERHWIEKFQPKYNSQLTHSPWIKLKDLEVKQ